MLTRPLNDIRCLTLILHMVLRRIGESAVEGVAQHWGSADAYAADLRLRPQLDDGWGVLPGAPRVACVPPARIRFDPKDPNCVERTFSWLLVAETLDPETPRTLMTVRVGNQLHVVPVVHTDDGPMPVNLDPVEPRQPGTTLPENLSYAAVAHLLGYGPGQPSPMANPVEWAEKLAECDSLPARNGAQLLEVAERYANIYPGGRQGLRDLAEKFGDAAKATVRATYKAGKETVKAAAEEYKERPELGQLLRAAVVGYGGPLAVLAIDVVENRLNKKGYTLGSMAESHDTDIFAFN